MVSSCHHLGLVKQLLLGPLCTQRRTFPHLKSYPKGGLAVAPSSVTQALGVPCLLMACQPHAFGANERGSYATVVSPFYSSCSSARPCVSQLPVLPHVFLCFCLSHKLIREHDGRGLPSSVVAVRLVDHLCCVTAFCFLQRLLGPQVRTQVFDTRSSSRRFSHHVQSLWEGYFILPPPHHVILHAVALLCVRPCIDISASRQRHCRNILVTLQQHGSDITVCKKRI